MAVVILLILFVFLSTISTWFFYQYQVKENKLKSDDFILELSSGRLSETLPKIAKDKGWTAFEQIGNDSFRFRIPVSGFLIFLGRESATGSRASRGRSDQINHPQESQFSNQPSARRNPGSRDFGSFK